MEYLLNRGPYLVFVFLPMLGTYLLLAHRNFLKAIIGMYLVQTGVILFFILLSVRHGATVPILPSGGHGGHGGGVEEQVLANPLPHALMLTAIVVGVAQLGLALAILRRIEDDRGTLEDRDFEEE